MLVVRVSIEDLLSRVLWKKDCLYIMGDCFSRRQQSDEHAYDSSHGEEYNNLFDFKNSSGALDSKDDIELYFSKGLKIATNSGKAMSEQRKSKILRNASKVPQWEIHS